MSLSSHLAYFVATIFNYRKLRKLHKGQNLTLDFGLIKMKQNKRIFQIPKLQIKHVWVKLYGERERERERERCLSSRNFDNDAKKNIYD